MERLLLIALGGALGTLARHGVTVWFSQMFGAAFPYATLAINFVGSFLLGVVMQVSLTSDFLSPTLRLALGTGVLGGFTTYSTFSYETFTFLEQGAWLAGLANAILTLVGCLLATLLGVLAVRRLVAG